MEAGGGGLQPLRRWNSSHPQNSPQGSIGHEIEVENATLTAAAAPPVFPNFANASAVYNDTNTFAVHNATSPFSVQNATNASAAVRMEPHHHTAAHLLGSPLACGALVSFALGVLVALALVLCLLGLVRLIVGWEEEAMERRRRGKRKVEDMYCWDEEEGGAPLPKEVVVHKFPAVAGQTMDPLQCRSSPGGGSNGAWRGGPPFQSSGVPRKRSFEKSEGKKIPN